jgi:hypothetical protein
VRQPPSVTRTTLFNGREVPCGACQIAGVSTHYLVARSTQSLREVVPFVVEFEVAVPRLTPAFW